MKAEYGELAENCNCGGFQKRSVSADADQKVGGSRGGILAIIRAVNHVPDLSSCRFTSADFHNRFGQKLHVMNAFFFIFIV